jgi:hypothetical protein
MSIRMGSNHIVCPFERVLLKYMSKIRGNEFDYVSKNLSLIKFKMSLTRGTVYFVRDFSSAIADTINPSFP